MVCCQLAHRHGWCWRLTVLRCADAGQCGYHVVPVQEILMSGRSKYQELLCSALAAQLAAQVIHPTALHIHLNVSTLDDSFLREAYLTLPGPADVAI